MLVAHEHPVDDRRQPGRQPDPHQHHPAGRPSATAGRLRMRRAARDRTGECGDRDGRAAHPERHDREDGTRTRAEGDAEDVGARERVAQQHLEGRAGRTERGAREHGHARPAGSVDSMSTNDAPGICSPPMIAIASGKETR